MTGDGFFMLLPIILGLAGLDLALWLKLQRRRRGNGLKDDFR